MRYGICTDVDHARLVRDLGYDYFEMTLTSLAQADEETFLAWEKELAGLNFWAEAFNIMFQPGVQFVAGDRADHDAALEYLQVNLTRARRLGCRKVVFGSKSSRRLPEGFAYEKGFAQLVDFLKQAGDVAKSNDVTIVIEPVAGKFGCNLIRTVSEGADLARAVGHPNVLLLCDLQHMVPEGEPMSVITQNGGLIRHAHISHGDLRTVPAPGDGYDYAPYLTAVRQSGCPSLSIEAGCKDFEREMAAALPVLKEL